MASTQGFSVLNQAKDRDQLLEALKDLAQKKLPSDDVEQFMCFATLYYSEHADLEMQGNSIDDIFGVCFAWWKMVVKAEMAQQPLINIINPNFCLLYTSPSPLDKRQSRMPSST